MKELRRIFSALIILLAPLGLTAAWRSPARQGADTCRVFVGTYTTKTASKGIYAFRYDASSGKLTSMGVAAETRDPSWVAVHPNGKFLYAANEAGKQSMISAFAIDSSRGRLRLLNQMPALGEDPCYLAFDKTGKYVLVANYTSGNVVVFPIGEDGRLRAAAANVRDQGKPGPNKERQDGPHAHWIQPSRNNGSVYVGDLGLDRVLWYGFDPAKGTLTAGAVGSEGSNKRLDRSAKLAPGTGPRHAVFSSNGAQMYVLGELESTVTAFDMMGLDDFVPTSFQNISALPNGFSGRNDAAEIAIHRNGKFLYASNRGHDSIALFHIDSATGKLTMAGDYSVEGKEPRQFAIDPSGSYLLAGDQLSDKIVTLRIDQKTGALTPTGDTVEVPSPVCIAFLPVD